VVLQAPGDRLARYDRERVCISNVRHEGGTLVAQPPLRSSTLSPSNHPLFHLRTKHIEHHFMRRVIEQGSPSRLLPDRQHGRGHSYRALVVRLRDWWSHGLVARIWGIVVRHFLLGHFTDARGTVNKDCYETQKYSNLVPPYLSYHVSDRMLRSASVKNVASSTPMSSTSSTSHPTSYPKYRKVRRAKAFGYAFDHGDVYKQAVETGSVVNGQFTATVSTYINALAEHCGVTFGDIVAVYHRNPNHAPIFCVVGATNLSKESRVPRNDILEKGKEFLGTLTTEKPKWHYIAWI
jgi:hypothetical protein